MRSTYGLSRKGGPSRGPKPGPPLPAELRERLRVARLANGLGYRRLAYRTGVDRRHLSRIEKGIRRPSFQVALAITVALRLDRDTQMWLWSEASFGRGRDSPGWRPPGAQVAKSLETGDS